MHLNQKQVEASTKPAHLLVEVTEPLILTPLENRLCQLQVTLP